MSGKGTYQSNVSNPAEALEGSSDGKDSKTRRGMWREVETSYNQVYKRIIEQEEANWSNKQQEQIQDKRQRWQNENNYCEE